MSLSNVQYIANRMCVTWLIAILISPFMSSGYGHAHQQIPTSHSHELTKLLLQMHLHCRSTSGRSANQAP